MSAEDLCWCHVCHGLSCFSLCSDQRHSNIVGRHLQIVGQFFSTLLENIFPVQKITGLFIKQRPDSGQTHKVLFLEKILIQGRLIIAELVDIVAQYNLRLLIPEKVVCRVLTGHGHIINSVLLFQAFQSRYLINQLYKNFLNVSAGRN